MDTLQLIEINQTQLLATLSSNHLNFSKSIKVDIVFEDVKNLVRKINHDILNDYIKSGPKKDRLDFLKKQSYDLFNILTLFNFDEYFIKLKKRKKPHSIQLILDFKTNTIPFEILNDGKDFLSDYIIFSRILIDSKEHSNQQFLIDSKNDREPSPQLLENIKLGTLEIFFISSKLKISLYNFQPTTFSP